MLSGGDRLPYRLLAGGGDLGVEVDADGVVAQYGVEVAAPVLHTVAFGQRPQLAGGAADEHGLGPDPRPVGEFQSALVAQGEDGADQMLAVSHAPGHTVHGDTYGRVCHGPAASLARGR